MREYLKDPLTAGELASLLAALGRPAAEMIRFKESVASALGISSSDERDEADWMALIADNPVLLERPIAWSGDRAVVGRPPEEVLALL